MRRRVRLAAVVLLLVCGCGKGDGLVAVSGTVTVKGVPLASGTVTLLAADGPAGGAMITDGRFEIPADRGVKPGRYRVAVSAPVPGGVLTPEEKRAGASPKAKESLPDKYNTATGLTADIQAGQKNHLTFDLD